ncbi:MAG TPA: lytic transglycosylase domain-containing protein [Thermoanaerobaculia bacterium]|nr:lytic transglycosylase domain-containing protein [Thermoanaerobaculia bacterium]
MKTTAITDRLSTRLARLRQTSGRSPIVRLLGGRGAATLLIGAALFIGGLSESFSDVHFLIERNHHSVDVVRRAGQEGQVVASLGDGFAGKTLFRLSRVFPDRYVSRQLRIFDESAWLADLRGADEILHAEMARINDAIRREFFVKSIPYGALIHEKAAKYDVDPALVAAVIEQESRFKVRARSHAGAAGLMQLMPRTGRWMGARDLYDPEQNVDAGVKYIKYLDKRFNGDLKHVLAAYNGGEGNVQRYGGIPPFRETQTYVKKVLVNYDRHTKELKKFEQDRSTAPEQAEGAGR